MQTTSNTHGEPSAEPASAPEAAGLLARTRLIYRLGHKPDDYWWARYATRPYAALILGAVHRLPITPNQITIASLVPGLLGIAAFACWPGYAGLWIAWGLTHVAYTLDCMDGMWARYRKMHSPSGVELDFLVDGMRQFFLFQAVAVRLWLEAGRPTALPEAWPLWLGVVGTPFIATALAMTTFLRSPTVSGEAEQKIRDAHDVRTRLGLVMKVVAFLMNYPSWILVPVIFDRMDIFLLISVPLYVLYCAYAGLRIIMKTCTAQHESHDT